MSTMSRDSGEVLKLKRVDSFGYIVPLTAVAVTFTSLAAFLTLAIRFRDLLPDILFRGAGPMAPFFMLSLAMSIFIAHIPIAIKARQIVGELRRINESLTIIADTLAVNLRTGLNFIEALRRTVPKITSPFLRRRILMLISYLDEGLDTETALSRISYGLPERVLNVLRVLIPASESGGRAPQVVQVMADFTRRLQAFEHMKIGSLRPYYYISMLALIVFEGATLFLLYLSYNFQQGGLGAALGGFLSASLPIDRAWVLSFYSNMVIVVFSSLFVSKVVRGSLRFYGDYLLVFLMAHILLLGIAPLFVIFGGGAPVELVMTP